MDACPVCNVSRYVDNGGDQKISRRVVRYFSLAPRLKRLYISPDTAKEMRWHSERSENIDDLRHPADGEACQKFNMDFSEFAREIRNVRLGLATDGFNPFRASDISHSTWPIVVIPYNLPPSMCMKREFNILAMLISGPKSPRKCLNVFMRPLIDELKMLWNEEISTYDRYKESSYVMKATLLWTISDFSGLGMLAGLKNKGYKACHICLDEIDAIHLTGRMAYQGHRRWLNKNHMWRKVSNKFNGKVELRELPPSLSGIDTLSQIERHTYPALCMHPNLKSKNGERLCWTHKSIFYELSYWETLIQPYTLDVMHTEKNVFDNIVGTLLGLEGKTKDDLKACLGLKKLRVRKHLWPKDMNLPQPPYTVLPEERMEILMMIMVEV